MNGKTIKKNTRRELLRDSARLAAGAFLAPTLAGSAFGAAFSRRLLQAAAAATDPVASARQQIGATPIQSQKLAANLTMLSGPGGNVLVLTGADGKFTVDTFVSPAWTNLKAALDAMSNAPLKIAINTHWHFDHTDNNAPLHAAGATLLAHENTKKRLASAQDIPALGFHFPPAPAAAIPEQTFTAAHKLEANGESIALQYFSPAHTDTDIYVHFQKTNVIHMGDIFFNGTYPFIDAGSGGKFDGMIAAANKGLALADSSTKIVPGHGPLGDKDALAKYRDMLVTARDRIQKLKSSGKSVQEAVAAKPFSDLDATWAKGKINGDVFVQIAYSTL